MAKKSDALIMFSHSLFAVALAACSLIGIMNGEAAMKERSLALTEKTIEESSDISNDDAGITTDNQKKDEEDAKVSAHGKAETGLKDGEYYGTGRGYGGDIRVKLTVKDGRISSLDIVSASGETPAYFNRARSVASSIVAAGTANVDGVSGATLSSNGIKAAAADAIKQAGGKGDVNLKKAVKTTGKKGTTKKAKYTKPSGGWKDGTYTGSAKGYGGTVTATVTIKNGKIKSISTTGKNETSSYWNRAQAVKSKIISAQNPRVDAVTGATYSSNGIINAVIDALSKAANTKKGKATASQYITTGDDSYVMTIDDVVNLKAKAKTSLTYKSTDSSIASVDKKGNVTAKSAGTTDIKITAAKTKKYRKASATVSVEVWKREQGITIIGFESGDTLSYTEDDKGKSISIDAYSDSKTPLVFSSDNASVATVDDKGLITITGKGTARIVIEAPETDKYEESFGFLMIKVTQSVKPDDPVTPDTPDKPDDPDKPDKPDDPDTPDKPDEPVTPDTPDEPGTPDEPVVPDEPSGITGVFSGSAKGYGGQVTAEVTIEDNIIKDITVTGAKETSKYWFKAKKIVPKMVAGQTWDVDAVSGATLSSNGIRDAVKQALEAAGLV